MISTLEPRSTAIKVVEAGAMIALNIASLLGNILVCFSVYRNQRLRTTTNLYMIALAVSDLIAATLVMPPATGVLITGRWPFGETACQIHAYFGLFAVYVSAVTMGLTALNRYTRICKSDQQYTLFFSKRKSLIFLGFSWTFVALCILIPRLTGLQEFYFVPSYAACLNRQMSDLGKILHYIVVLGLFFALPLEVTIFSYRKVLKKIREHNTGTARNLRTNNNETVTTKEIRLSKSLFVVVFAFMLCWLPAWVITILTRFLVSNKMPHNVQLLCTFSLNISNAINPFIYAGMNPVFRREFRRLLVCRFGGEKVDNHQLEDQPPRGYANFLEHKKFCLREKSSIPTGFFCTPIWPPWREIYLYTPNSNCIIKKSVTCLRMVGTLESRSTAIKVVEAGAMIALNIASLLGNILVCLSVYRNNRLRTTTNLYIIALAVTDLIAATLVMPPATGVLITGRWPFGETACQIHAFFSLFAVYVSPVTMGLTALNRYTRICKSDQQYNLYFSKKKSRVFLGSTWTFVALYILIPRVTGLQDFHFVPSYAACLNRHLSTSNFGKIVHYFVVLGLFFALPLAVTIFSYRKVLKKIREHNTGTVQSLRMNNNKTVTSNEIRLSKSLFVVVFAFMLCWVPAWVITILTRLFFGNKMPRNVQLLCTFFLNISNAINPFIYAGMNPVFRREFRKLLGCKFGVRIESSLSRQSSSRRPATSWIRSNHNITDKTGDEQMESIDC
ncbi:unnamed protein product [Porites evermanni]|uniref:G-protein coupled receptors family 1 profile domain-containing protein n=2 Tax=Porites TaxID=46719 RepID=A0ABN8MBW4_9CNID|nr:unnamed protein product [Porites evermanni]